MPKPKEYTAKDGYTMHYSAGAVIRGDSKYLLIDRAIPPLGFAGVAGHIDEGETPEEALVREVKEEVGLDVAKCELLCEEEVPWNECSKGIKGHYWYLFSCEVSGELERSKGETKSAGWYTQGELKELSFEPVWEYWLRKLEIL